MSVSEPELPSYGDFAQGLYRTAILSDPWLGGKERFRLRGLILDEEQARRLKLVAERVAYLHHKVAEIVWHEPRLVDEYFGLTPYQKAMWLASEGRWHGIARVDLFICTDGRIRACEMNSDTPSGEAEAVLLNDLLHPFHPGTDNPNLEIEERFWQMLLDSYQARLKLNGRSGPASPSTVAIIYPTDLPEDLSMIALYRSWLERRGCRVVLGSPFNLRVDHLGRICVLDEVVDLIVRHYKTDWWGEREAIWLDQPAFPDPEPLDRQILPLLAAASEGKVTVVNPFGAVLVQNKIAMAFMWEHRELFSQKAQKWIEAYIPETRRFIAIDAKHLDRKEWVLKAVYGCEGDSVICGIFVRPREWRRTIRKIVGRHWVVQRYFQVAPIDDGLLPNYGVYVIGGIASGFYSRLSKVATDYSALTAPTFVKAKRRRT